MDVNIAPTEPCHCIHASSCLGVLASDAAMPSSWADSAMACPVILFGLTVRIVLTRRDFMEAPRDLDVAELWSGVGSTVRAATARGLTAVPFDIGRCPGVTDSGGPGTEDITSTAGFLKALQFVVRLRCGGLLVMAPVCSSFGFCNMRNTKRKRDNVRGDESYPAVQKGNLMADIASFFLCIAVSRAVHVVIENPAGSMLFRYIEPVTGLFTGLKYGIADRCAYDTAAPVGQRVKKPYKFLVSGPWLQSSLRKCTCPGGTHETLMQVNEKGQVTGKTDLLRASAAYPAALGAAIIAAWLGAGALPDVQGSSIKGSQGATAQRAHSITCRAAIPAGHPAGADQSGLEPDEDPWEGIPEIAEPESAEEQSDHAKVDAKTYLDLIADPWQGATSSPESDADPWHE
jgi:hypothetical protein